MSYTDKVRNELPDPGQDPMQHAQHTLAAFRSQADDQFIVRATTGIYITETGLTWGDLRELVRRLEAVERHLGPGWPWSPRDDAR